MSNFYSVPPENEKSWISKFRDYLLSKNRWDNTGHVASWHWREGDNCYSQKGLVRGDGYVLSSSPPRQIACGAVLDGSHQGKLDPNTGKLLGYTWDGNYWRGPATR